MDEDFVIVDVSECISRYRNLDNLYDIYKRFPLQEIIGGLLTPVPQYSDIIWFEFEGKFTETEIDSFNLESVDMFFETLTDDLDRFIADTAIKEFTHTDYIFVKWLSSRSVLLRRLSD